MRGSSEYADIDSQKCNVLAAVVTDRFFCIVLAAEEFLLLIS